MAESITIQELIDARTDAKTLEEAVNGDAVTTVLSRLGESYPTLANALSQIDGKLDSADTQISKDNRSYKVGNTAECLLQPHSR